MGVTTRSGVAADADAVRHVHRVAFGRDAEADLVDALRAGGHVRASLVAEEGGRVVGHVLFTELLVVTGAGAIPTVALAPVAVLPECQNRGVGSELVRRGLEACRGLGYRAAIVLGRPHFYARFGFSAEMAAGLESPYAGDAFLAVELVPGTLAGVAGRVEYPPPFAAL